MSHERDIDREHAHAEHVENLRNSRFHLRAHQAKSYPTLIDNCRQHRHTRASRVAVVEISLGALQCWLPFRADSIAIDLSLKMRPLRRLLSSRLLADSLARLAIACQHLHLRQHHTDRKQETKVSEYA